MMKKLKRHQKSACGCCHEEHHESACGCSHDEHHESACGCSHDEHHESTCGCSHEEHHESTCGCCHDEHQESTCGCCHDEHHESTCGCEHSHGQSDRGQVLRYLIGAIFVILGFLPFLPFAVRVVSSAVVYVFFGASVWRDMLSAMRRKRIFTEFSLMCSASLGAILIGEFADAAAVMYLYSLGEMLSEGACKKTRASLSELFDILPESATVFRNDEWVRVTPESLKIGERILVLAGERIPIDGIVVEGSGSADTSSVTGESLPLALSLGVACPSGTILQEGSIQLRVTERYENSVVAKLAQAVREASKKKSSAEKKIARFAGIFTPIAFGVAVATVLLGTLLTGELVRWLRMGLTVLVVCCPCSLVLSVPLTYYAGIGAGARRGIVFRGGEVIDRVCRLQTVAFDKTGTLTEPTLGFDGAELFGVCEEREFLSLAYEVLVHSPHAAAISFCGQFRGEPCHHRVSDVEILGGRGIVCRVDGRSVAFGNAALMRERGVELADSATTAIFGEREGALLGKLKFSSHLKKGSAEAIRELRRLGVRRICVISGDGEASVASVCAEAGIDEFAAGMTPSEKYEFFLEMMRDQRDRSPKGTSGYCGDGLNDSAVIAGADVGIAMGGCGSALTVRSADVVLMDDDPRKLGDAIRIARKTSRIASQNIALSLGIKIAVVLVGGVLSATTGMQIPLGLAIVADVGAAILAVLSALRARK